MAQISVTVPDAQVDRVLKAFTTTYGYSATLPNGSPNPQTPTQFVKSCLAEHIRQVVLAYESNAAAESARRQAAQSQVSVT